MNSRAFTLVELLVSVAIFTMMTVLLVVKYGNFNQSVLLTNLAYDVALTIRTAQTYGLSVKNVDTSTASFDNGYGVHFDTSSANKRKIIFFADRDNDKLYTSGASLTELISTYELKRGAIISGLCVNTAGCTPGNGIVSITFKRPNPNAIFCLESLTGICLTLPPVNYVEITVKASDGGTRVITVRENGQITVKD